MNDVELKRDALYHAYSSDRWKNKVQIMSEAQVVAIYIRLKTTGKLG